MKFITGQDALEGLVPVENFAAVMVAIAVLIVTVVLIMRTGSLFERFERPLKYNLAIWAGGFDLTQSRLGLAVPRAGPANRMHDGNLAMVATGQVSCELARLLEQGKPLVCCGLSQAPMQVKLVVDL